MKETKTLIVGAGAIGGTLAVLMNHGGYPADVLEIAPGAAEKIAKQGLRLTGARGDVRAFPNVYSSVEMLDKTYDIVIIAVKYMHLQAVAESILPLIHQCSLVVGMQNGICTDELAQIVGEERAVGCMIGFGATKHSDTEIEMTSGGEMYIGMPNGAHPGILDDLCTMYSCVVKTKISDEIVRRQFSKLIINCCINATAAITGKTLGEILDDKRAQDLFLAIAREGMDVADVMKIKVPKYGLLLDYRLLRLSNASWYNGVCKRVVKLVGKGKYAVVKPSTLQSLLHGEKTEVDIFNGWLARKAEENGIKAPVNALLTKMIHELETGARQMTPENLEEFKGMI
ncbi:MAG: ketopantoate reductase family protein [Clostridia bacterium]|nr:ketopantoate reductase family protein [Clostridia bacterium]